MTQPLGRHIEDVLKDAITRLDRLEDPSTSRWLVLPIIDDLWALLVDIQTSRPVSANSEKPPRASS